MNPYTDQKNRAYAGILTSLFPEQTKTVPRIILWSIVFLVDLTLGVVIAYRCGLLESGGKLAAGLLVIAIIVTFWLQGKLWYGLVRRYQKSRELG